MLHLRACRPKTDDGYRLRSGGLVVLLVADWRCLCGGVSRLTRFAECLIVGWRNRDAFAQGLRRGCAGVARGCAGLLGVLMQEDFYGGGA